MTTELATQHADSLAQSIREATENGFPFGVRHEDSDAIYSDMAEALAQHNDPDVTEDDFVGASGMDYLSDVLDIQYIVNYDRSYRAARVLIGFGGPNVWINTLTSNLEVAWWSEMVYRDLPEAFISGLDDALSELWEMGA